MSETKPVQSPHDRLFRYVFSVPEHAAGELRAVLPPDLVALIDWSTLRRGSERFVDTKLLGSETDLLYHVNFRDGGSAYLSVLLEHQSDVDRWMPVRLLRYEARILEQHRREHPGELLPVVIPVVVHHSSAGWKAATSLRELSDVSEEVWSVVAAHVPNFEIIVDDLSKQRDDALRARATMSALGRLALLCLKHARQPGDFRADLGRWLDLIQGVLSADNGVSALAAVVSYILEATPTTHENLEHFFHQIGPSAEQAYMNGAQELIERGIQKGREEGRAEVVLRLLHLKFGTLSEEVVARVHAANSATLDVWVERVLTATTLEQVFAD